MERITGTLTYHWEVRDLRRYSSELPECAFKADVVVVGPNGEEEKIVGGIFFDSRAHTWKLGYPCNLWGIGYELRLCACRRMNELYPNGPPEDEQASSPFPPA